MSWKRTLTTTNEMRIAVAVPAEANPMITLAVITLFLLNLFSKENIK